MGAITQTGVAGVAAHCEFVVHATHVLLLQMGVTPEHCALVVQRTQRPLAVLQTGSVPGNFAAHAASGVGRSMLQGTHLFVLVLQ